jgi:hypothetical protein
VQINSVITADYASIRDQLLYIVAGGINVLSRSAYPARLGLMVAIEVLLDEGEIGVDQEVTVILVRSEDDAEVARVSSTLRVERVPGIDPNPLMIPYLPLIADLRQSDVPAPGVYFLKVQANGREERQIPLLAEMGPDDE